MRPRRAGDALVSDPSAERKEHMKSLKPTTIAAGAVLAIAFVGGVVFGPSITPEVAASVPGGADEALPDNRVHGDDLFSAAATCMGIYGHQLRTQMGTYHT